MGEDEIEMAMCLFGLDQVVRKQMQEEEWLGIKAEDEREDDYHK